MFDLQKNQLLGIVNIGVMGFLTAILGILLIFHIKNFQDTVSYKLSWNFVTFDSFATKLMILIMVCIIINAFSGMVLLSELFSPASQQNIVLVSMSSILWIVLFLASNFSQDYLGLILMPVMISGVILMLSRQTTHLITRGFLYASTALVWIIGFF